jgi:hypothetical protein
LHVELVSVEEKVWSGEAEMVVARTTEGELGVLPRHAPLLGQLAEPGQVRIKLPGGEVAISRKDTRYPRCCRDPTGSTRGPIEVAGRPSV